jgi:hypothetical protein
MMTNGSETPNSSLGRAGVDAERADQRRRDDVVDRVAVAHVAGALRADERATVGVAECEQVMPQSSAPRPNDSSLSPSTVTR